jgi:hypothetical protein
MRDVVTFAVGIVCFALAGAVFVFEDDWSRKPAVRRESNLAREPEGDIRLDSEKTTKENRTRDSGRAAS